VTDVYKWYSVDELMAIANPMTPQEYRLRWARDAANVASAADTASYLQSPYIGWSAANDLSSRYDLVAHIAPRRPWWKFWK